MRPATLLLLQCNAHSGACGKNVGVAMPVNACWLGYGSSSSSSGSSSSSSSSSSTSSTTTTRVVCGDIPLDQNEQVLSTPQNFVRIEPVPDAPDSIASECQCIGGDLRVVLTLTLTANFATAYFVSITSVNGTEATAPAFRPLQGLGNQLFAGTVAFNGFPGLGAWVIKLLDASGNPSIQNISRGKLEFGLQACN
mmetsp:Transcript_22129/g.48619  ORF Transcript_22129/g.48619 Transcript_22129/m.48619 type:complete len:195 (+) Transcript_22129:166-750(+)